MPSSPESVGMSSERLARIDTHLRSRYVDHKKIAGALTLVARRGQVVHASPLGLADLERGAPVCEDTIFRIYSMTKPITSVALMTLYEQGRFQLGDAVHKYIPEWKNQRVYVSGRYPRFLTRAVDQPMTVRHLMTHTSGLTYGFMERTNVDAAYRRAGVGRAEGAEGTLREMVEKLASIPLEFSPGSAWNYSVATDVLAYLVEVISGQPFDEFLRTEIFEPLGMVDTHFALPPEKLDRFAACYTRGPDKNLHLEDDPRESRFSPPVSFLSGGGGLVSTASDYMRFCQMLLGGGALDGKRILSRKTLELMTKNHLPAGRDLSDMSVGAFSETPYEGTGFGLGFSVQLGPERSGVVGSAGEFAWGGAASTIFWVDPSEELAVVFMTQLMPSHTFNFRGQLKSIVYGAIDD